MVSRIVTGTWSNVESAVIVTNSLIQSLAPKYVAATAIQDQAQKDKAFEALRSSLNLLETGIYDDFKATASRTRGYENLGTVDITPHEKLFLPQGQDYYLSPKINEVMQTQNIQGWQVMQNAFDSTRVLYDIRTARPLQSNNVFLSAMRDFLREFNEAYPGYPLASFDWTVDGPLAIVNTGNGKVGCTRYGLRVYGYSLMDLSLSEEERTVRRQFVSELGSLYGIRRIEQPQVQRRGWFRRLVQR